MNTGDGHFAAVAGVTGFDFADDSRAVAVLDYDGDGDLDLWVSNRTAPRVRLLRNNSVNAENSVRFSLEGRQSNRDAIGAQVKVHFSGEGSTVLTKTVRAGEGYLAQSSKTLHFGLAEEASVERVEVWWPGRQKEVFAGVVGAGRYRLVEGAGSAEPIPAAPVPELVVHEIEPDERTDYARIVPHAPLLTPQMSYVDLAGESKAIVAEGETSSTLVMLWATYCTPCLNEMKAFEQQQDALKEAGLSVLPLNVEGLGESHELRKDRVTKFLQRHRLSLSSGLATTEVVESLDALQRAILGRQIAIPVPCSFLLDSRGRASIVYKGSVEVNQLLRDVSQLRLAGGSARDRAVPMPGIWYVNPLLPDQLAYPEKLLKLGRADTALRYMRRHYPVANGNRRAQSPAGALPTTSVRLASLYERAGLGLLRDKQLDSGIASLQSALVLQPDSLSLKSTLGLVLQQKGEVAEAVKLFRDIATAEPNHVAAINSLAWMLATTGDPAVRNVEQALQWAQKACMLTQYRSPAALNSLAAAYAANGDFSKAIAAVDQAINQSQAQGRTNAVQQLEARKKLFQSEKALVIP